MTSFLLQKVQKTFSERTTNPNPNRRAPSDQGHVTVGLNDSGGSISVASLVREHVGWVYFIYAYSVHQVVSVFPNSNRHGVCWG